MERSPCSICGQHVPTSNLELHESRCQLRQQPRETAADPRHGRPVVNITEYNNAYSRDEQEWNIFRRWWPFVNFAGTATGRRRALYVWVFLGLFVLSTASAIFVRIVAASGRIILLAIRGQNDFSVLEYYIRIYRPSSLVWLWPWQWALLLEYHVSTMKCLRAWDVHECCSSARRETFLRIFLGNERGPTHDDDHEWLVPAENIAGGSSNNDPRFKSDAWYKANYDYLAAYHFKDIVSGYENVQWLISGYFDYHVPANQVELRAEIGRTIRGHADDFVNIVESLEWKQQDKHVWLDYCEGQLCSVIQWNAYATDVEAAQTQQKLVGRIQCWESVAWYLHNLVHHHRNRHQETSLFRWEYHPELDFASNRCDERNAWHVDFYLEYPVCMAEVVVENENSLSQQEGSPQASYRTHTMITGAASHNLQCLVNDYQIYYDDCSSSWNLWVNNNPLAGYGTGSTEDAVDHDSGAVKVAHLMKDYVHREVSVDSTTVDTTSAAGHVNDGEGSSIGSAATTILHHGQEEAEGSSRHEYSEEL